MRVLSTLALAASIAACAGVLPFDPEPWTFLSDYERLKPGPEGEDQLRYMNPDAHLDAYGAVMLEPVQVWRGSPTRGLSTQDAQALANRLYSLLYTRLSRDFRMVRYPARGALRIGTALTGTRSWNPTLDTVSTVLPVALSLSELQGLDTGKPAAVAEANIESRVTDGRSGEVLIEGVDRRVGRPKDSGDPLSWSDIDRSFASWADRLAFMLCREQKRSDCTEP